MNPEVLRRGTAGQQDTGFREGGNARPVKREGDGSVQEEGPHGVSCPPQSSGQCTCLTGGLGVHVCVWGGVWCMCACACVHMCTCVEGCMAEAYLNSASRQCTNKCQASNKDKANKGPADIQIT